MSISIVTSASNSSPLSESQFNQRKKNLDALETALNAGDLQAAQSAFDAIQEDMQKMPKPGSGKQSSALTQLQDDFQKIEEALASGDVDAAKEAFATWQEDIEKLRSQRSQGGHQASQTVPSADNSQLWSNSSIFSSKA